MDINVKLFMIGDSNVGKTALAFMYHESIFFENITKGDSLYTLVNNGALIEDYESWWYDVLTSKYYKLEILHTTTLDDSITNKRKLIHGVLLVYDINSQTSFQRLLDFSRTIETKINNFNLRAIENQSNPSERFGFPPIIVLGNQNDKMDRQVAFEDGQKLADSLTQSLAGSLLFPVPFVELSAKSKKDVESAFGLIVQLSIYQKMNQGLKKQLPKESKPESNSINNNAGWCQIL